MGRYRKIDPRMYGDEKFRRLTPPQPNGQSLFQYLFTGPHTTNVPGLSMAGEAQLAEALGWPIAAFRKAFGEAFREGLVEADWKARVLWVPNVVVYDKPESPNVVKSWATPWGEIPECRLKAKAFHRLAAFLEGLGPPFREAFSKACRQPLPHPLANPEPEPKQEPEPKEKEQAPGGASVPEIDGAHIPIGTWFSWEFWPAYPKHNLKGEAEKAIRKLNPDNALRDRILRALEARKLWSESAARGGGFLAEWPDPHRWVNKRRWEDEPPPWWGVEPYRPDPSGTPSRRPPQPLTDEEQAELDRLQNPQESV